MQTSGSGMIQTEIGRRRPFIIFNGGLEERQEPCQIVKMHNCSGQMVVERPSLSMIHERSSRDETRRKRSLSQEAEGEAEKQQDNDRTKEEKTKTKTTTKTQETLGNQQIKFSAMLEF